MAVVDGALAAAILFGLIVNAVAGWWWADIAAGVVLILYGLHEGRNPFAPSRCAPMIRVSGSV
jgi:divalent metal cation (Fe/Co/Zn/Cd) transporter